MTRLVLQRSRPLHLAALYLRTAALYPCIAALCPLAAPGGALAQTTTPPQTIAPATGSASRPTTTTYRWVDGQGVVHYSDTAQPGAQVIHLPAAQTYHSPPTRQADPATSAASGAAESAPRSCTIAAPASEASFYAPESVEVSVSPGLQAGDQLAVTLDGAPLESTSGSGGQFQIQQPDRGAHAVSATVRDTAGKVVCLSTVTFYVQRPSALSPTSPARGH